MRIRRFGAVLAIVAAVLSFSRALQTFAQTAPDGTVVQGGVAQGPPHGDGGGQFPFGRGAGGSPAPAVTAPTRPTPIPTPSPTPSDAAASSDVLHPSKPFATAQCQDGWFSFNQMRDGTCAGHGGVMIWIVQPGDLDGLIYQRAQEGNTVAADIQAAFATPQAAVAASASATPAPLPAGSGQYIP